MTARALTNRELEVLQSTALGVKSRDAAQQMGITLNTYRSHREAAMRRLGAHTIAHAVAIALRRGVIE